jgi:integrase
VKVTKKASVKVTNMTLRLPYFRSSKGTWYAWIAGRQRSLGVKGEENEDAAYKAWHHLCSETPTNALDATNDDKTTLRLADVLQRFLDDAKRRVGSETYRGYEKYLRPVIEKYGRLDAAETTPEDVSQWSDNPAWSSSYRHGFVGVVVTAFRWAVTKGVIANNPIVGVRKPPKASRGRRALISADEHETLVARADADFADFLRLLWSTGARPSEIAILRLDDVDFANAVAILSKHKTAHLGKERIVVLNADALDTLRRRSDFATQHKGLFFVSETGEALTAKGIGGRMRRTCERAGLRRCIAYGYRHTYATDALAKGVPETSVAALLGHTTTVMLHKHYSHLTSRVAVLRDAVGKIR